MTVSTRIPRTATAADVDVDVVRAVFGAFARGDLAELTDLFHADATWQHHNQDRFGGINGRGHPVRWLLDLVITGVQKNCWPAMDR
jgi:hypothetical protein